LIFFALVDNDRGGFGHLNCPLAMPLGHIIIVLYVGW